MLLPHPPVERDEGRTPGRAVGGQEAIEGVVRPGQRERVGDEGHERDLVDDEPRVAPQGLDEIGVTELEPAHLRQEFKLQQGDG